MKVLVSLSGTAAVNVSGDLTAPKKGILQRDFISHVASLYNFTSNPVNLNSQITPNMPLLQFQAGVCLLLGEDAIPVIQLLALPDGDAVTAQNTDLADLVLTDYITNLERELNFRFSEWNLSRMYQSFLLVEFEPKFVANTAMFQYSRIVTEAIAGREGNAYSLKRLALGNDASNLTSPQPSIHQFMLRDFVIERRVNEPMEDNRFFCSAPMTTGAHIRCLEALEACSLAN
jgi:hypothetical protein